MSLFELHIVPFRGHSQTQSVLFLSTKLVARLIHRARLSVMSKLVHGSRRRATLRESVMNAQLRRRLETAARVRDFLRAHQMDGVGESLGLAKLEQLLERAENLATQQRMGTAAERSAVKERQAVRRVLQPQILGYLSVVGAVAASKDAELAEQFRMPPSNATHQALRTMSRASLERATAQKGV